MLTTNTAHKPAVTDERSVLLEEKKQYCSNVLSSVNMLNIQYSNMFHQTLFTLGLN